MREGCAKEGVFCRIFAPRAEKAAQKCGGAAYQDVCFFGTTPIQTQIVHGRIQATIVWKEVLYASFAKDVRSGHRFPVRGGAGALFGALLRRRLLGPCDRPLRNVRGHAHRRVDGGGGRGDRAARSARKGRLGVPRLVFGSRLRGGRGGTSHRHARIERHLLCEVRAVSRRHAGRGGGHALSKGGVCRGGHAASGSARRRHGGEGRACLRRVAA